MSIRNSEKTNNIQFYIIVVLLLIVLGVGTYIGFVVKDKIESQFGEFFPTEIYCTDPNMCTKEGCKFPERQDWGVLGDYIGGVLNPIFSFLGLLFLFITIIQNQKVIVQSESELRLSREELHKSNELIAEQSKTQKTQQFENTFFFYAGFAE